ncbi:DUF4003 family protein [Clostridium vincentii]|uniref:DUF4003 domain-containing protein n=1 Tax=Clostridium vincentii TaxID=52704 RepID=A0A2T0BJ99_9CLOT|nr:DUF4003 family protein [Clostridium vincentii]PRR83954.1 hypothetical protein CLVI_06080 [Clostridium vincentii]
MEITTKKICDLTIKNYRKVREELRYDGDYINHLAALIYAGAKREVPCGQVKLIRSSIKEKTSRMSSFRGDILYVVSFLIALEDDVKGFISKILSSYNDLLEIGFKESKYLVLTCYTLVKHSKEKELFSNMVMMKDIYEIIKSKYRNVTNDEDYLECALLSINGIKKERIIEHMDNLFRDYSEIENLSKNSIQSLTMAVLLNKNKKASYEVEKLLIEFEEEDVKIGHQFLSLLGMVVGYDKPKEYIKKVDEVINYLCKEEGEYEFYMDKSFRVFIGIVLVEASRNIKEERYINELLSEGVYSSIISKNQGVFEERLA